MEQILCFWSNYIIFYKFSNKCQINYDWWLLVFRGTTQQWLYLKACGSLMELFVLLENYLNIYELLSFVFCWLNYCTTYTLATEY